MRRAGIMFALMISIFLLALVIAGLVLPPASSQSSSPRVIKIAERQFGFTPEILRVSAGETVIFKVRTEDVTHGFYIDGFSIYKDIPPGETVEVGPVKFDKPGKFKIRCSTICGPLHPFMVADIIVEPNIPFYAFIFLGAAVATGSLFSLRRLKQSSDRFLGVSLSKEIDLLKLRLIGPILKRLLQWRGVHFFIILPNLLIFMIVLTTGFFGNPIGAFNFSIAVVWILWFAAVEFMILFASRFWCSLCPLPAFGEWLARRRLFSVHEPRKWFSLGKPFPKSLSNMWIPALGFLGISLVVPWLVTRPVVTGILFLLLISLGLVLHLVYTERYFCRHVCPASGYIGHHSTASIFAVRSRDKSVCDKCVVKGCVRGTSQGYGCPWKLYPGGNDWNAYCGLDFECLKSCPLDNMTLKLRMIAKDIVTKVRTSTDEAWMGFIRFSLVVVYMLVFFGPYFWIKDWGNMSIPFGANLFTINLLTPTLEGFRNWLGWAVIVTSISLIIFPAIFFAFSWLAKKIVGDKKNSAKQVFLAFSNALTPYALLLWIAFAITLVTINWAYPIRAFSDPLGWGWNIFGTGTVTWQPIAPDWLPYIQAPITFLGLMLAIESTHKIALNLFEEHRKAIRATIVMAVLYTLAALLFVWIIAG